MKRSRLTARERTYLREIGNDVLLLRGDWHRRLRNALLALMKSDPQWMLFVDREIYVEVMSLQEITRLIEARARWAILRHYSQYSSREHIGGLIFCDSWTFTDSGNLGPG